MDKGLDEIESEKQSEIWCTVCLRTSNKGPCQLFVMNDSKGR